MSLITLAHHTAYLRSNSINNLIKCSQNMTSQYRSKRSGAVVLCFILCLLHLALLQTHYAGAYKLCVGNIVAFQSSYCHLIEYQQTMVLHTTFRHAYSGLIKQNTRLPTTPRRFSMQTACRLPSSTSFHPQFRNSWLISMANHSLRLSRLYSGLDTCPSWGM